ncbi:unnamed protein product [Rhizoctonia solani]|uniref:Uncharacterized protein n=1 Tax=Rhizoctonia solani TaxID=456999 RepID=A0A8H3C5B4_9AGAM|nr:unnamed protein product [Rhizoctonia solani]
MRFHRTLGAAILFSLPISSVAQTVAELGVQLTAAALKIQGAISPTCRTLQDCQTFNDEVVPRCQRLQGDAGCWCGNHNPLHNCAICMSSPTDTTTTPDQMAAALGGHTDYHTACNAFEKLLNASSTAVSGTSTATSAASTESASSDSGSKAPIGAIVGGAVGGGVALIIGILVFVLWRRNHRKEIVGPSSVSLFSGDRNSTLVNQQPRPYSDYSHPQGTFGHHDSSFGAPNYAAATMPYQGNGTNSLGLPNGGLKSDGSYNKHPEPMSTPY